MRKIYFLLIVCCLQISSIHAQTISAAKYPFTSATSTTLVDMSTGTTQIIGPSADDPVSAVTNIGFDFWFNGVRQTQFSVNGNGLMRLGATVVTNAWTNTLAAAANYPCIAPYWDDLWVGPSGKVHYKVTGTAPNRVLVVEWLNIEIPRASGLTGSGRFQVWLGETTGKIDFVYGTGVIANSTNSGYSVGFGTSGTVFASVTTSGPTCAYGTANNTNTNAITNGTKYTFTPLIPAAPTAINFTSVTGTSMTVNWTAASPTTNIYGYALYRSTDGGANYTFVNTYAGATTATAGSQTGLTAGVTYTWKVVAYTEGGLSSALVGSQATPAPACSGTPTPGTVSATTSSSCSAFSTTLSLSGATTGVSGLTYQWQTSTDNSTWTSVSGATNSTYAATVSSTIYYRCVVGCSVSGLSANTPGLQLVIGTCISMTFNTTTSGNICSGILYDDGGPSGNYNASAGNSVYTIYPGATGTGSKVSITFTSFSLESGYDYVYVYNGNSTAATLMGTYTGTTLPGTFLSTAADGSLTVRLTSDGIINATGFAATITNTNPTPITAQPATSTSTCIGYSPSIAVTASGTNTYLWYDNGTTNSNVGGTSTGVTTASYSPSTASAGTKYYYCVVTNACGVAFTTNTAGVTVNPSPSAITGTFSACSGNTSSLSSATGGGAWTTSSAIASVSSGGVVTASATAGTTTVSYTVSGCSATAVFTVYALPGVTSSSSTLCNGTTSTLTNTGGLGTWTSSNTSVATIGSSSGIITGLIAGTTIISYANGCGSPVGTVITVNQTPGAITGSTSACVGATATLSNPNGGGTWSSSNTSIATVVGSTGVVTGVASGTCTITYTLGNGCAVATRTQTVSQTPSAITITPASTATVCLGSAATFTASATPPTFTLLDQNFNTGMTGTTGGTWTVINSGAASIYNWAIVAPGAYTDLVISGDGSNFMETDANLAGSGVNLISDLRSPSFSTSGLASASLTFNYYCNATWSTDYNSQIDYSIDGGSTWTTLYDYHGTTTGSTTWTAGVPTQTIALPSGALGQSNVKLRWYYNSTYGFYWAVDNIKLVGSQSISYDWSGVSGATGLSCTTCASPTITPTSTGSNVYSVVATSNGCTSSNSVTVSVNPTPAAITGTMSACLSGTSSLSSATGGGTWSSSNTSIATIGSSSGVVTASATTGTTTISYIASGCPTTAVFSVNTTVGAFSGTTTVCTGNTTTLTNAGGGGTWTSTNTAVATAGSSTGIITGVSAGTATISYTNSCGGSAATTVTVNLSPGAITGSATTCHPSTTSLSSATGGGTWSSGTTAVATIDATSGLVTSVTPGTTTISYTLGNGCAAATRTQSVNVAPPTVSITPSTASICYGNSSSFTVSTAPTVNILNQNFNTSLADGVSGTWTILNSGAASIYNWAIVAPSAYTDFIISGDGTNFIETDANLGGSGVNLNTQLRSPVFSTAGMTSASLTFNYYCRSDATYDVNAEIDYSTDGGSTWNVLYNYFNTTTGAASWSAGTPNQTIALPSGALNKTNLMLRWYYNSTYGWYWAVDNIKLVGTYTVPTYTWSDISGAGGLSCTTCAATTITPTVTGTNIYSVSATANGCSATNGVALTVNPLPAAITGNTTLCVAGISTLASATGSGTWTSSNTAVATAGISSGAVTGVAAGTATITYTITASGCYTTTVVTVQATPTAGPTNNGPICNGGTVTLTANPANGANTYSWSGPFLSSSTSANPTAMPTTTSVYSLTVSNGTSNPGCAPTTVYTTSVTVNSTPTAAPTNSGPICNGGTVTLTANPGGSTTTYAWSGPNLSSSTVANPTATPTTISTYSLIVSNGTAASGCAPSTIYTTTVTVNPKPTASPSNDGPICNGGIVNLSANPANGASTYSWSGPNLSSSTVANPGATPTVTSTYSLTVTNGSGASGCSPTTVYTTSVTVNSTPTAAPTNSSPICNGGTVTLTANPGGSTTTYSWSGSNLSSTTVANPTATPTVTTVYSLTVTNGTAASGCAPATIYTTSVTVNSTPTAAPTNSGPICNGGTVTLTANPGGSTTTYSWSGPNLSSSTVANPTATPTVTSTYSLTVTNGTAASGCVPSTIYTTSVTVNPKPTANPSNDGPICNGGTVNLTANPAGGAATYSWSGPSLSSSTDANPAATPTSTSVYSLTVTDGSGAPGCSPTTVYTTSVTVNSTPTATPTNNSPICNGGTVNLTANPGGSTTAYSWSGPGLSSSTLANPTATPTVTSTYSLMVTNGTTASGCVPATVYTTIVSVNPTPAAGPTNDGPICNGGTVNLTANPSGGATTYSWSGPNLSSSTAANPTATPTVTSTYSLTVTDGTVAPGCVPSTIYTTTVTVNSTPTAAPTNSGPICNGGTVNLTANPGGSTSAYSWSGPNLSSSTAANPTAAPTVTSTYSLTVTNGTAASGCAPATVYTTEVTVKPTPVATPTNSGLICNGGTVNLTANPAGGATVFTWSGPSLSSSTAENPSATPSVTSTYSLTVSDGTTDAGCSPSTIYTTTATVNPTPVAAPTNNGYICIGGTVNLTANPSGGATVFTWSGADLSSTTIANPTAVPTVTGTYSLTVSDGSGNPGCSPSTIYTTTVTVNATPIAAPTNSGVICVGGTVTLSANGAGGASTYSWSGANLASTTVANPTATPTVTSVYSLTVSDASSNPGCSPVTVYTTEVTVNPAPSLASATNDGPICEGITLNLSANTPSNVTDYSWSGPVSITGASTASASVPAASVAATGTYTVTVNNGTGSGCTTSYTTTAEVNAVPTVASITPSTTNMCVGTALTLNAGAVTGAGTLTSYNWSGPNSYNTTTSSNAATFTPTTTAAGGVYTLSVTYPGTGCTSSPVTSSSITVNNLPTVASVSVTPTLLCAGNQITFTGSGASGAGSLVSYNWSGPAGYSSTTLGAVQTYTVPSASASGVYSLSVTYTGTGCTSTKVNTSAVTVNPLPVVYDVTGGGFYCSGGSGVHIGLNSSESGISYQLYHGSTATGAPLTGTGSAIDFGLQTAAGTYSVFATNLSTGCTKDMNGSTTVAVGSVPTVYTVTGGGNYCNGGTGVHIGLSSSDLTVGYQLYKDGVVTGSIVSGTGVALDFGLFTATGIYSVMANPSAACAAAMTGTATVGINPLPISYNVTGGGAYCSGGTGVHIGMDWSVTGITYQLYNGASTVGSPVSGSSSGLDFGLQTAAGTYTVVATNITTGCVNNMTGSATITINPLPTAYNVTGTGSYCADVAGRSVGLDNSATGFTYQLYNGATIVGTAVAGTGAAISFGTKPAGTYSVLATNSTTGCTNAMTGSAVITMNALPTAYTVTGGGNYCVGGSGYNVGLSNSTSGINYQLYNGASTVGSVVAGTGVALDFGVQSTAGTYTVLATNASTSCVNSMSGSAVIAVNALPVVYTVTGGGIYCAGGSGVAVGVSNSQAGVNYQLYNGATTIGSAVSGTNSAISFGTQTMAGTYTVVATDASTTCASNMSGSATVSINSAPAVYAVTGGGSYCAGASGVNIGLNNSTTGINYQLYRGATAVGSAVAGTNSSISFGPQTTAGTYSVVATNPGTGCTSNMSSSASVSINPLPASFSVTGGGDYCTGGSGVSVGLAYSNIGINYQLYYGAATVGSSMPGTSAPLNFGLQTTAGTYTVLATDATTSCTQAMAGSATVIANPLPTQYSVTGGGNYCAGGTGVHVGVAFSTPGVNYQLYNGSTTIGSPVAGSSAAIDFGLMTAGGVYTVYGTSPTTGCSRGMTGSATVVVNPLPTVYTVTGGGSYCNGGTGVNVGLSNSTTGISYQLYNGSSATGSPVAGTGSAISFGSQTAAGTYTVFATNTTTSCTNNMSGSVAVSVNPLPTVYTVTGGGSYCNGGTGYNVGLSSSSAGINYQLYNGSTPVGSAVAGTGAALNFGVQTAAGTYTVFATNATTSCTNNMSGSATIIVNPLPTVYTVTGGGNYCTNGTGVSVGLSNSSTGINYQLYYGSTAIGSQVAGTGSAISFGTFTAVGTYTVFATNGSTGCTNNMSGSATIGTYVLPTVYTVNGGGNYCAGSAGLHVGLSNSTFGINYQLYNGSTAVGAPVAGLGSGLDFGVYTATGTYTVRATNATTGCVNNMAGSTTINIGALPTVYTVTGGGGYCNGGTGVTVGLSASTSGINYQLYRGSTLVGSTAAGTGSAISFGSQTTAGTYSVLAISPATTCTNAMSGTASVVVNVLPTVYTVTGGGNYCVGGSGVNVGLSNSTAGVNYQLYNGSSAVGSAFAGTGAAFDFGLQTTAGTYTVVATNATTGCVNSMTGSVVVTANPLPTAYTVTGGGNYCIGGSGVDVGLNGSNTGVNYQLYFGAVAMGSPVAGTGGAISFGAQTFGGTYSVVATNATTGCVKNMTGTATIVVNSTPVVYSVTGGGSYCNGTGGVGVGTSGSTAGINYQLYSGSTAIGSPVAGTGSALSFGFITAAGTYTVAAVNPLTGCSANMTGSATVTVNSLPIVQTLTGGGNYCAGGSGVSAVLGGSTTGVNYQLYNGATTVGAPVAGTGSALSFALTTAGTYSVLATNATTSCASNMSGTAAVVVNALPVAYTVTGGGNYCSGGSGVHVGISNSENGINYQLYRGSTAVGSPVSGAGTSLDFGFMTSAGTYSVAAINATTGCASNMSGTVSVAVNALPTVYTVGGGGNYCTGGAGMNVTLSNSTSGINYQLYRGTTAIGSAIPGVGSILDFGLQTVAGTYTVRATNPSTGCVNDMAGSASVNVNSLPTVYTVTGGGNYCSGGSGVAVGLSGSTSGISYRLYNGPIAIGSPVIGTGSAISFGSQTSAGSYSVVATNTATTCSSNMTGSVTVVVNTTPSVYNVTGGGSYCSGGNGVNVGLDGTATGVSYQLYNGSSAVGVPVSGTGGAVSFGLQTTGGTYSVLATAVVGSCQSNMAGTASVNVNALPIAYDVTGGGVYCSGGTGVNVNLGGSQTGINYQLYRNSIAVGSPVAGTGSAISFGLQTMAGVYKVIAANASSLCVRNMNDSASVFISPLPTVYNMTGGGSYCTGSTGVSIGLSGSNTAINYQLYNGATPVGTPVVGTGSAISFGTFTASGTYSVVATHFASGCSAAMAGTSIVSVNGLPTVYTVTGTAGYCSGGSGVPVSLSGSAIGVNYQLYLGTSPVGTAVAGTGSAINFGAQLSAGAYSVVATDAATGCVQNMASSATVTIHPLPSLIAFTGGGSYCSDGTGVVLNLPGSELGVNYQLMQGATFIGVPVAGTGSAISFGTHSLVGTYNVIATNSTTTCTRVMTGSASISVNPVPVVHTVTGGGNYCVGGSGVAISLDGTETGINYKLLNGSTAVATRSGTGAAINFGMQTAAGTYTAVAINASTGCTSNMTGSASVNINALPTVFTATGGGSYCAGGNGVNITLSSSAVGVNYQLLNGTTPVGIPVAGTGAAIAFGLQTLAGTYSVRATDALTSCTTMMAGNPIVSINPLPNGYAVMGGGSYCNGGAGVNISINGSNTGVSYQLFNGGTALGAAMSGTGSAINFGAQTAAGTYSVIATDNTNGCMKAMTGTASVSVDALPTTYTVTGGGNFCNGAAGVAVGLSGSETGVNYQLYNGSSTVGSSVGGTTAALAFGLQTSVGVYSVKATNPITGCVSNMTGTVGVVMNALPVVYNVTGGGNYCAGGVGVSVGLSGSNVGINYQLYNGSATVGGIVAGNGSAIGFGNKTLPGTYTVVATDAVTGCISNMSGSAVVNLNPLPSVFTVTGGGNYCSGGTGVNVGLSGSATGITYQLYSVGTPVGSPVSGTGSAINLGAQTAVGIYNVFATNTATGCVRTMAGSVAVGVNPTPDVQTVTGGGNYCTGGAGVVVGLANSAAGTYYQLYNGAASVGGPVAGTGYALSFGSQTAAGTYSVVAINSSATCTRNMSGTVTVGLNPLPTVYSVVGGGAYCSGGNGVHVGLGSSETGINYQLYYGAIPVGTAVAGTGTAIDFGLQTALGSYSVRATNATTSCVRNMTGTVNVSLNALPNVYSVTGGGNYCAGTSGIGVGLSGSTSGVSYQLYSGSSTMGAPVAGTGSAIDFGLQTFAGTYTVVATNTATTCRNNMTGSASVGITPAVSVDLSLSLSTTTTICAGTLTTFTANPVNGGTAPTYVWRVNGAPMSTGGIFSYVPANGDVITSVLTSNATCALPDTASSSVVMTVNPNLMPAAIVSVTPNDTLCDGSSVTFTAAPVNGGTAPSYVWMKNGMNVGTGTTYTYTPVNNDVVYCRMTSNFTCRMVDAVNSTNITLKVNTPPVPTVSIQVNPGTNIAKGQSVAFTAVVTNGGPTPTYQWMVNGSTIPGATLATFTSNNFADQDTVSCHVMSSGPCGGLPSFNSVTLDVSTTGVIHIANTIDVRVMPNPNKGEFSVKGTLADNGDEAVAIEITDMLGQIVYTDNIAPKNGNIDQHITLSKTLANGMYMLSLRSGTERKVFHIVLEQ